MFDRREERMDTRWADIAYKLGLEAAREGPERRRRWARQNEWDAEQDRKSVV